MAANTSHPLKSICLLTFSTLLLLSQSALAQKNSFGMIFLKNGQVLSGIVGEVPGGYGVQSNGQSLVIPADQVDVAAPSLLDAYQLKKDRLTNPTAEDHMILARWCLQYGLLTESQDEIVSASMLNPHRDDSRELPKNIEQLNATENQPRSATRLIHTGEGFLEVETRSSAGLYKETQQEFSRKIQPLLLNKCGNAYCHGEGGQSAFRLTAIRSGHIGNRIPSNSNLLAVIDQIDMLAPEASPLLVRPANPATGHPPVFQGTSSRNHLETLTQWVHNVANSKGYDRKKLAAQADPVGHQPRILHIRPEIQPASHETTQLEPNRVPSLIPRASNTVTNQPETTKTEPKSIRNSSNQSDQFDPEIFNRKMHGTRVKPIHDAASQTP